MQNSRKLSDRKEDKNKKCRKRRKLNIGPKNKQTQQTKNAMLPGNRRLLRQTTEVGLFYQ